MGKVSMMRIMHTPMWTPRGLAQVTQRRWGQRVSRLILDVFLSFKPTRAWLSGFSAPYQGKRTRPATKMNLQVYLKNWRGPANLKSGGEATKWCGKHPYWFAWVRPRLGGGNAWQFGKSDWVDRGTRRCESSWSKCSSKFTTRHAGKY